MSDKKGPRSIDPNEQDRIFDSLDQRSATPGVPLVVSNYITTTQETNVPAPGQSSAASGTGTRPPPVSNNTGISSTSQTTNVYVPPHRRGAGQAGSATRSRHLASSFPTTDSRPASTMFQNQEKEKPSRSPVNPPAEEYDQAKSGFKWRYHQQK